MRIAPACALLLLASCQGAGGRAFEPGTPSAPTPTRVEPRLQAGIDSLRQSLEAGEDEQARAILSRLWSLGPDEPSAELLRSFERVLGGRESVKALDLRLVAEPRELPAELRSRMPAAMGYALQLQVRNPLTSPLRLVPGPATLASVREEVSAGGAIVRSQELRPFQLNSALEIPAEGELRVPMAEFFLAPRDNELAVRLAFTLELRAGTLLRDGQELPAMRWNVTGSRTCAATQRLREAGAQADPHALLRSDADALALLEAAIAVPEERVAQTLADLCAALDPATRVDLTRCHKALCWLAGEALPEDPSRLQQWISARRPARPRPDLKLPR
ncbi:MAG: hypothetical protein RL277_1542 [Planctomycetota bacterium]|jgi:hypothetical protein